MTRKLYRSRTDKKLLGVLGGIAKYFNIDATILRIIYVLLALFAIGSPILIYLIAALIIPEEPENPEYQEANYQPVDDNK
ncbi:MAG: PspC domain-containing protein [Clostridia bacterium]|nr:PspC domain-containing protein [Clostridia bacterium]